MSILRPSGKRTASNITGSVNLGDVNGDLIQIYNDGPLPPELTLPWRTATKDSDIFALLEWRTRLSDLVGRDEDLNELLTWARTGAGISARFLTGPGGAGKSRLAAETAQILANEGWSAGFAPLEGKASYPYAEQGAFLIVDYPEENREAVTTVLKILGRTPSTDEHSLRILLVSRERRDQWQSHIQDAHASSAFNAGPIAIENVQSANDAYTVY